MPPKMARIMICRYLKYFVAPRQEEQRRDREDHARRRPTRPAEPIVWTMLFSRIVLLPIFLKTAIASTAIGTEAETVSPAAGPGTPSRRRTGCRRRRRGRSP